MKAAIAVLAVAVVALALWVRSLEQSVAELTAARIPSLDLQAKCAAQARKAFAERGWDKRAMTDFKNHYNPELNKCYMLVEQVTSDTERIISYKFLEDAFEGTEPASFSQSTEMSDRTRPGTMTCTVTLPSGEKKECRSQDDFFELLKAYMGGGR